MGSPVLRSILVAAALLPAGVQAGGVRVANLIVSVVVVRPVHVQVPQARAPGAPGAAGVASSTPLVFVDGAPPGLVVELRGVDGAGSPASEAPSRVAAAL
jgi:hypothetical protein